MEFYKELKMEERMSESMPIEEIGTRRPFKDYFVINPVVLSAIKKDMEDNRYDATTPIILWGDEHVVVDGHTRLQAARDAGLKEVDVCIMDFDSETDALKYMVHCQQDRRNLSDAEIYKILNCTDEVHLRGGDHTSEAYKKQLLNNNNLLQLSEIIDDVNLPSHIQMANTWDISPSKVQQFRVIKKSGDKQIQDEVENGVKSINIAAKEIKKKNSKQDPLMLARRKLEKIIGKSMQEALNEGLAELEIKQIVKDALKAFPISGAE